MTLYNVVEFFGPWNVKVNASLPKPQTMNKVIPTWDKSALVLADHALSWPVVSNTLVIESQVVHRLLCTILCMFQVSLLYRSY